MVSEKLSRGTPGKRWRLPNKCRRHFSNFKCWELASRRWRHSCNSNQPELRQLSKREADSFRLWERCARTVAAPWPIRRRSDSPFLLKGTADQDSSEYTHKVRTFMLARFGDENSPCSTLASTTAKDLCQYLRSFRRDIRFVPWITVFGEQALENKPPKTKSTTLMILLESSLPTLCLLQPTQPTGSLGTLEKEMA